MTRQTHSILAYCWVVRAIVSILPTHLWTFPMNADLEHRRRIIITVTNEVMEALAQFLTFDTTVEQYVTAQIFGCSNSKTLWFLSTWFGRMKKVLAHYSFFQKRPVSLLLWYEQRWLRKGKPQALWVVFIDFAFPSNIKSRLFVRFFNNLQRIS